MSNYFLPYAASFVVLKKGNQLLLTRRFQTGWLDGWYSLPSGHIDAGESASAAAVREAKEEVGVTIDPSDLTCIHICHRSSGEDGRVYVDFFYLTETWQGEPTNREPDKCDDVQWFDQDSLPENIVPVLKNALEQYQKGSHYSELGW